MLEPYSKVVPPEIRIPSEKYSIVEFFVGLDEPRPDLMLMDLVHSWLSERAPLPLGGLNISYHRASNDEEPSMLVGVLYIGEPLDVG